MVGTSSAWNSEVALAEMSNLAANRVLGRSSGTGIPESLQISGGTGGLMTELDTGGSNSYLRPAGIRTGLLAKSDTTSTTMKIENTVAETNIWSSYYGFSDINISMPTIAANTLVLNSTFEIRAIGTFGTTGTPTMQFRFGITPTAGSFTPLATTGAITVPVSGMSGLIEIYGIFNMQNVGATANGVGNCYIGLTDSSTRIHYKLATPVATRSSNFSSAVNGDIKALFQWGTASASNTVHFTNLSVLRLK
jgi:hypothetical protein